MPGIELLVNPQPQPDGDPGDQRESEDQGVALDGQKEVVFQMQDRTRLVSRLKSQRSQDDVG